MRSPKSGGVESEFTITRDGDKFYAVSAGAAERHDHDVLLRTLPRDGSVALKNITLENGTLVVCGPRSRDLLKKISDANLSNEDFPWLTSKRITVNGVPLLALRVNFVGELGWELHHPIEQQVQLFDAISRGWCRVWFKAFWHVCDGVNAFGKIVPHVGCRFDP